MSFTATKWIGGGDAATVQGAKDIAAMSTNARDNTELGDFPGGASAYDLYEAQKLASKQSDKLKRVTENNSFSLYQSYDYVANVDGVHFGVSKQEDPDEDDDESKFVYAYQRLDEGRTSVLHQPMTADKEELFSDMRANGHAKKLGKGDVSGHEFHGNQWTQGGGSAQHEMSDSDKARMKELGVPPAWTNVRLNPDTKGALQVIGKDSKGREQRIYSAAHSERAAAEKFARLKEFNNVAPKIESSARADMNNKDLPQATRDAAAATYLISQSGIRVGSDRETGAAQKAYGATTLQGQHVSVNGDRVQLDFVGKKGVSISKTVEDAHLAAYLGSKTLTPGAPVFATSDTKVRDYFHAKAGNDFKVKDFRTLVGTRAAINAINAMPAPTNAKEYAKYRMGAGRAAAAALGNTPAIALAAYVDPSVFGSHTKTFAKSDAGDLGDYFECNRYDKTPGNWRTMKDTFADPDDESVPVRGDGARLQAVASHNPLET